MKNNAPNTQEENDIDDEIIEVFIEEAGEVKETLDEHFPQWKVDFNNQDALTIVRRAFHTLKGSGRMVQANDIGELAWSVENMLNRVIDRTVPVSNHHAHLIERVLVIIPPLIDAFEQRQTNPLPELTAQYMAWGDALAGGDFPEELASAAPVEGIAASKDQTQPAVEAIKPVAQQRETVEAIKPADKQAEAVEAIKPAAQQGEAVEAIKPAAKQRETVEAIKPAEKVGKLKPVAQTKVVEPLKPKQEMQKPAARKKVTKIRRPEQPAQVKAEPAKVGSSPSNKLKSPASLLPWLLVGVMVVGLVFAAVVIF